METRIELELLALKKLKRGHKIKVIYDGKHHVVTIQNNWTKMRTMCVSIPQIKFFGIVIKSRQHIWTYEHDAFSFWLKEHSLTFKF